MTRHPEKRIRLATRSLWQIFSAPILIALVSSIGLITALVGDGLLDVIAWIGLGVPAAVGLWFMFRAQEGR
ncbi:hypothetical protein [Hyphomicrobium sp.]|uniref:hypothetical protein n=1 Tax=Hyphomicrobium sp. TaxID=82 RepID=UPI002FDDFC4D